MIFRLQKIKNKEKKILKEARAEKYHVYGKTKKRVTSNFSETTQIRERCEIFKLLKAKKKEKKNTYLEFYTREIILQKRRTNKNLLK